jgi:hypothetical protein
MHEYDVTLKNILTRPGSSVLAQLTGLSSLKWLNVEAPKVSNRRVDLLGELPEIWAITYLHSWRGPVTS